MPPARRLARLTIRAYQLTASALLGRQCRYLPTCSDYASEAIALHGLRRGVLMGAARVCRCHPWGGSGYDPVPREAPALGLPWPRRASVGTGQERASSCADRP